MSICDVGKWYHVTICCECLKCLLGEIANGVMTLSEVGEVVDSVWQEMAEHYSGIKIDEYQVMPNHIHGVIFINQPAWEPAATSSTIISLSEVVKCFKTLTTYRFNEWPDGERIRRGRKLWGRGYFEQRITSYEELERVRKYIKTNPDRWKKK